MHEATNNCINLKPCQWIVWSTATAGIKKKVPSLCALIINTIFFRKPPVELTSTQYYSC